MPVFSAMQVYGYRPSDNYANAIKMLFSCCRLLEINSRYLFDYSTLHSRLLLMLQTTTAVVVTTMTSAARVRSCISINLQQQCKQGSDKDQAQCKS